MKVSIHITPDATLTESDFRAMQEMASKEGLTTDEWAASAIRRALNEPKPGTQAGRTAKPERAAA